MSHAEHPRSDAELAEETERIVAFWTELSLPGLFDVHTHFMPKNVMDKV